MSRLDKLLELIATAPTSMAREAAAHQLGEIINSKPEEIGRLLTRIYPFLIHKKLETRIAAGIAIESMAKNVPIIHCSSQRELWKFKTYKLNDLIDNSKKLFSSDDQKEIHGIIDIDIDTELSARQKTMMRRKQKKQKEKEIEIVKPVEKIDFNCDGWPFRLFCEKMLLNIFDPKWEVRHGAAISLREVLRKQADAISKEWKIDIILRLILVISLDRFADFISDTIIAPVRETCAQAIGIAMRGLEGEIGNIVDIICEMYKRNEWEIKHGSLLILKYAVAIANEETTHEIFKKIQPILITALQDVIHDESVAVAAEVMRELVDEIKDDFELLQEIRNLLWEVLENLDEITASTNNVLQLLQCIDKIAAEKAPINVTILIDEYINKLLPFSGHVLDSVRTAVMETFNSILTQILTQLQTNPKTKKPRSCAPLISLFNECCVSIVSEKNDYFPSIEDLINNKIKTPLPHNNTLLSNTVDNIKLIIEIISIAYKSSIKQLVERIDKIFKLFLLGSRGKISKGLIEKFGGLDRAVPLPEQKERFDILFNGAIVLSTIIQSARKSKINAETKLKDLLNLPNAIMLLSLTSQYDELHTPKLKQVLEEKFLTYQYDDFNSFEWNIISDNYKELKAEYDLPAVTNSKELENVIPQLKPYLKGKYAKLENTIAIYLNNIDNVVTKTKATIIGSIYTSTTEPLDSSLLHHALFREDTPLLIEHFTETFHQLYKLHPNPESLFTFFTQLEEKLKNSYSQKEEEINDGTAIFYDLKLNYSIQYFLRFLSLHEEYQDFLLQLLQPLLQPPQEDPTNSLYYPLAICVLPFLPLQDIHYNFLHQLLNNIIPNHAFLMAKTLSRLLSMHKCLLTSFITLIYPQLDITSNTLLATLHIFHHMCLSTSMATLLIPIFPLLITPFLAIMNSNKSTNIRRMGAQCFSVLLKYLPLHIIPPADLPDELKEEIEQKKIFISFLYDGIKSESIAKFSVFNHPINGNLRPYQKEGISWLLFLHRYCINGILCDDMGLGKTLQALCLLVSVHKESSYPSLIICPPTLTAHWKREIETFIDKSDLRGVIYSGVAKDRKHILNQLNSKDVLISSYEMVRKDLDVFSGKQFNYCILDEGHIIKNPKTKLTIAVKQVVSLHRLILTGTPIQNNVLELWSLFDFLMPGFLGTEKEFSERYSRPIIQAKDSASPEDQEKGVFVMEKLHRQVLPFILRRLKENVLQDLPPKTIQDYYCEMSEVQKMLYQEFEQTNNVDEIETVDKKQKNHIFQILNYFRKLCVHPKLVLDNDHPMKPKVDAYLKSVGGTIDDIDNSPKLKALAELLVSSGIGKGGNHRVLIFAQLNETLKLIEEYLFKREFSYITYRRLDGRVQQNQRTEIIEEFSTDPTIDVLLITTRVGGLGLNLTAADIVIFMEHDWNPTKDLQAMDRAHRLGQQKHVLVYRLIVKQTLEERIMNLQQFKTKIANTVVTRENETFAGMNPTSFVELFNKEGKEEKVEKKPEKGLSSLLYMLGDWDEEAYGDEYNLDTFVDKAK